MKNKLTIFFMVLFALAMVSNSCDKVDDNPFNCTQLATDYLAAYSNYTSDPSAANCIELKNEIQDYLDSDCPALTDTYRAELQTELNSLDCN